LFGGCFTVLSNLIGTGYLPEQFSDTILFIEDTDENPGRLLRLMNQWRFAGLLEGINAIVVGHLRNCLVDSSRLGQDVLHEIHIRTRLPVFATDDFGHVRPNYPLMIGADAELSSDYLRWNYATKPIQS
jgi:muramoyltetrapeptide carboxypeptidase